MRKLRLLLFEKCNRSCKGCCNDDWNLKSLEKATEFSGYDEIILTGGEPMLKPMLVMNAINMIRRTSSAKIFMYTAESESPFHFICLLNYLDGITLTLHNQGDVEPFIHLNKMLLHLDYVPFKTIRQSLRLNIFKDVGLPGMSTRLWKIKKDIEWIKNAPLPKYEEFKRL